ncbi:MAG: type II toxin-antitoxin system Phd/YefM family antitoxin [Acidobacteriota bacterium]|nr:type II toxin-antitoxin system Phd/YefM family antitoxin [Acidobacteriota bacterium]MDQ5873360.1 type II toxin-antitoxin system Phd/YefM family antitoxin [Acidobacteriota bacterium]
MRTIPAARFKARCLKIMDEVKAGREPVLITKKGKPVARLLPAEEPAGDVFGCLAGELEIAGDIVAPLVPSSSWKGSR